MSCDQDAPVECDFCYELSGPDRPVVLALGGRVGICGECAWSFAELARRLRYRQFKVSPEGHRIDLLIQQLGRDDWLVYQTPDGLVALSPAGIPIPEPLTAADRLARLEPGASDVEIVRALVAACSSPTCLDEEMETVDEPPRCGNCGAELDGDWPNCMTERDSGEEFCSPTCRSEWEAAQDAPARADAAEQRVAELEAENEQLRERTQRAEDLLLEYIKQDECEYAPDAALDEGCDLDCQRCRAASLVVPSFHVVVGGDDFCAICGGHHSDLREGRCPACREGRQP